MPAPESESVSFEESSKRESEFTSSSRASKVNSLPPLSPFAVLGVTPEASQREIRRAFLKRALKCHPDKRGAALASSEDESKDDGFSSSAEFVALRAAFDALREPQRRDGLSIQLLKEETLHKANVRLVETTHVEGDLRVFECRCGEEIPLSEKETLEAKRVVEVCGACGIEYTFASD